MNRKIIGLIFCTILISTVVLQASGTKLDIVELFQTSLYDPVIPPLPGDMKSDKLELQIEYKIKRVLDSLDKTATYDENVVSLIQQLDEEIYLDYLEDLVAFGPRVTATEACENAGDYIYDEFISMGLEARKHYWEYNGYYGNNIEATIQGVDDSSNEIFIVCAHYDSVPNSPGADDDGSGTALVLSSAKLMSNHAFNNTVRFVAFSGEEQGLFGSHFYAQEAAMNNDNIIAVLNADMIGFALSQQDESYVRIYDDEDSDWITDFTYQVSQEYSDIIDLNIEWSGWTWGSDHFSFWEAGYHAIFYAEYNFNDYYHSPDDIIEHMNIPYALKVSKLIIATLAELSEITDLQKPSEPSTPVGTTTGKAGIEYTYTSSTTDPQDEQIYYLFDWGDGTNSGWLGLYESGEPVEASHKWDEQGNYQIRVKAKDIYDHESGWSDALSVSMPKNRFIIKLRHFSFFDRLAQKIQLFRHILNFN
jgi:hypothetical protein